MSLLAVAPGVRADHRNRLVVDAMTPEDAHAEACFYHGLIPHGDQATEDALAVIRAAHEFGVCPASDDCPIPIPDHRPDD